MLGGERKGETERDWELGGFQGWGRRQGELPHILCVTGNSLWILSRSLFSETQHSHTAPQLIPCIFLTLPGAARHLWPAFWSFCDFPSYQGQSLSVAGRLGSRQGADDTQSLSLSPSGTAAIICTVFSSFPFPTTRFHLCHSPEATAVASFLLSSTERKLIFFKYLFNTLLKGLGAAKRKTVQRTKFLYCSEQFSSDGQLHASFFKTKQWSTWDPLSAEGH